MKTKNLFKILSGFTVLILAFCLYGCSEPLQYPGKSLSEGFVVRSVQFYFTNVSDGRMQCIYEFCDKDGCCHTPAEKVDTFRLMSDHLYVCSLALNGENPREFFLNSGELAQEYSFSYIPQNGLDLMIDWPDMEDKKYSDLSSDWTTGQPGNGAVNLKIRHCPYNFMEGQCYEISLPVVIE